MSWILDLPTAYRDHGLAVVELPGWHDRGGAKWDWIEGRPVGVIDHHFVISYASPDLNGVAMLRDGYAIPGGRLDGPVSNDYVGKAGVVYLIAAGPASHAGRGVRAVLNAVRSDRAVPDRPAVPDDYSDGSRWYWGTETHHPGGAAPMPDAQLDALARKDAALCELFGWSTRRVIMHRQHTRRKDDLRDEAIGSPAAYRGRVARHLTGGSTGAGAGTTVGEVGAGLTRERVLDLLPAAARALL